MENEGKRNENIDDITMVPSDVGVASSLHVDLVVRPLGGGRWALAREHNIAKTRHKR